MINKNDLKIGNLVRFKDKEANAIEKYGELGVILDWGQYPFLEGGADGRADDYIVEIFWHEGYTSKEFSSNDYLEAVNPTVN